MIDKLKLEKRTATVQRTPAPGATGALASAKLLDAVFGNDAVQQQAQHRCGRSRRRTSWRRRASSQHTPARTLPLAEVKDQVRERVVAEQAAALARKEGEARLAQLQQGADAGAARQRRRVSRAQSAGPAAAGDRRGAAAPTPPSCPLSVGVDLGDAGLLRWCSVTQVLPRDPALGDRADHAVRSTRRPRQRRGAGLLQRAEGPLQGRDQAGWPRRRPAAVGRRGWR